MDEQITTGTTTFHLRKQQDMKFNMLMASYNHKTKIKLKKVDFFDKVLELLEKQVNSMPTKEIINGQVVYIPPKE